MRCCGEERRLRRMPTRDVWVRSAGEYGELVTKILERFKIRREGVARPTFCWEKMPLEQAEIRANGNKSTWDLSITVPAESRTHGIEKGKRKGGSGSAEKCATGKGYAGYVCHIVMCRYFEFDTLNVRVAFYSLCSLLARLGGLEEGSRSRLRLKERTREPSVE